MKEKSPVSKKSHSELLAEIEKYFSKFEELRGFL
jgi:hypothetical protein